jgi:hypothetical protein
MTAVNSGLERTGVRIGVKTGLAALASAFVFTLLMWVQKWPFDAPVLLRGTDDMVRMVNVRDLLAGQSWFDLLQPRLGAGPGTLMHWSRLIDAPLAALVTIGNAFSAGSGERFAAVAWPFLMFAAAFAGLLTGVRRASGSMNILPALVIGGFALIGSGVFDSGVIDHHNAQLALTVWLLALLLPSEKPDRDFAAAGVVVSLMLAIGLESLPIALAAAGAVMARMLLEGDTLVEPVRRFGLALSLSIAALFFALVGPQHYSDKFCDSFSLFHLVCAGAGGLTLYIGLHPSVRNFLPLPLVSAPSLAGIGVAALTCLFFPDCLRAPGASLDPKLRHFWFDQVVETQSFLRIAQIDPWLLPYMHVLPLLAAGTSIWMFAKGFSRSIYAPLLIFIAMTSAVTLFQMRGMQYAIPVAAMALAVSVTRFAEEKGQKQPLRLLAAMGLSCILVWKLIVTGAIGLFSNGETGPLIAAGEAKPSEQCGSEASIASLNALPAGLVAGSNDLGPLYLLMTDHRVLAGPYHRDVEGNLAWINAMTGTPQEAHSILANVKVKILAICPSEADEVSLSSEAPNGFLSQLIAGKSFDWLQPVQDTMDKPLKLWRFEG